MLYCIRRCDSLVNSYMSSVQIHIYSLSVFCWYEYVGTIVHSVFILTTMRTPTMGPAAPAVMPEKSTSAAR